MGAAAPGNQRANTQNSSPKLTNIYNHKRRAVLSSIITRVSHFGFMLLTNTQFLKCSALFPPVQGESEGIGLETGARSRRRCGWEKQNERTLLKRLPPVRFQPGFAPV
ncbi:hypothetical protein CRENBAI_010917 [Crenichthys baileyi]|uniref:Uncharacterized protein n=1 Tax=Crenichthys baileyi TaxID=28760 RepID=A0AAV9RUV3_9TELE